MTSTERTTKLSTLGRDIATELRKLNPLRPWTFVEPTEDTYSVYLRNAGQARIYIQFDGYNEPTRLTVSGYLHIGKNGQYVEVYERGADGRGWNRASVPIITIALKRGPEAIAKDIAKRFLPEYLRVFALAEAKGAADAEYDGKITANLQRLAKAAGENVGTEDIRGRGEVRKDFTFRVGDSRYYTVTASAKDCSLKLDALSIEQAEVIIRYLKSGKI